MPKFLMIHPILHKFTLYMYLQKTTGEVNREMAVPERSFPPGLCSSLPGCGPEVAVLWGQTVPDQDPGLPHPRRCVAGCAGGWGGRSGILNHGKLFKFKWIQKT